jgi:hypothetical protein
MKMLKSYLFWTYERGSFHYDVMVTLILVFIFLSPRVINFHDRPQSMTMGGHNLLVQPDGSNAFTFEVSADQIPGATKDAKDDAELREELERRIAPITGSVAIDRWQAVKDASGKVTTYKVWARR